MSRTLLRCWQPRVQRIHKSALTKTHTYSLSLSDAHTHTRTHTHTHTHTHTYHPICIYIYIYIYIHTEKAATFCHLRTSAPSHTDEGSAFIADQVTADLMSFKDVLILVPRGASTEPDLTLSTLLVVAGRRWRCGWEARHRVSRMPRPCGRGNRGNFACRRNIQIQATSSAIYFYRASREH